MELPYSTSVLHHQASQNVIAAPRSCKAKAFCRRCSLPASPRGWPGVPTRGRMVGQADHGLWTFFFQMNHLKLRQWTQLSGSNIFHSKLKLSQVNLNSSRSWRYKNRSCHLFCLFVCLNCDWRIVALQCCVSVYSSESAVCTHTPSAGIFFHLGHRGARPPCHLHW